MNGGSREPHQERSLVILKPDAVQRSLIGEIVGRFERVGLKISALKMLMATEEQCIAHYNKDEEWFQRKGAGIVEDLKTHGKPVKKEAVEYGRDIIRLMVTYMTAAPLVAFIVEGNQAVAVTKKLVGTTEPTTSDVGTIRGDFTIDSYAHSVYEDRGTRNLIHCSDSVDEAEREIDLWFTENEIMQYVTAQERIMYDVNFDSTPD